MFTHKTLYLIFIILLLFLTTNAQEAFKIEETSRLRWDISESPAYLLGYELNKSPDSKGLIIVFGKRGTSTRYAEMMKKYLNLYKFPSERILTAYGGDNDNKSKLELWVIPQNAKIPQFLDNTDYNKEIPFDEYSLVEFDGWEYLRLDTLKFFAKELKSQSKTKAYIIVYPSNRHQAKREALKDKKLLNKLGIKNTRITTLVGNYVDDPNVELWIVPEGAEPPKPTLTVKNSSNSVKN